jgi:hyaluronoglucosaminidase
MPRRVSLRLLVVALLALAPITGVRAAGTTAGPYRYRGVIFGPYGRPWTHEDRVSVLGWMGRPWRDSGRPRMNIYIHAAKDDVYQRVRWRVPYPAPQMTEFIEEITLARAAGVEWVPNISPGVPLIPSAAVPDGLPSRDICFSCASDLNVLVAKLRPFAQAGVRTFMISFDDVQKVSTHLEDALAYGVGNAAYGGMNADLLNRVRARLRTSFPGEPAVQVLTVPADYSGTAATAYLKAFGRTLAADIPVMWTGTSTVPPEILAADAAAYSAAISTPASGPRKLVVWDNFPVNDYNGNIFSSAGLPTNFKLNVGPYKGRGADLTAVLDGIVANPMNEAEASKIPLYSVAAYLNEPSTYTAEPATCELDDDVAGCLSEAAWLEGIAEFGGPVADAVFDFVAQMRSTPMDRTESPVFRARWEALRDSFGSTFWPEPWDALVAELNDEGAAPDLLRLGLNNDRFIEETAHHLATLEQNVAAGLRATELLAAIRPALEAHVVAVGEGSATVAGRATRPDLLAAVQALTRLLPAETLMSASPYSVHGDRFQHSFDHVYVRENQMDAFTGFVHEAFAGWLPAAPKATTGAVTVTVNGIVVPLDETGAFEVTVPIEASQTEIDAIASDGAGIQTGIRLPL